MYTHTLRGQVALGYRHVQGFPANHCAGLVAHENLQEIGHMHEATRRLTTYVLGIKLVITGTRQMLFLFIVAKFTSDWLHHGSGLVLAKIGARAVPYWRHRR